MKFKDIEMQNSESVDEALKIAATAGNQEKVSSLLFKNENEPPSEEAVSVSLIAAAKNGHTDVVRNLLDFSRKEVSTSSDTLTEDEKDRNNSIQLLTSEIETLKQLIQNIENQYSSFPEYPLYM